MSEYDEEKEVVARIRNRFTEEAKRTDNWLIERGWDEPEEALHIWLEAFADRTTEAAQAQEWKLVEEHTNFVALEYRKGSEKVRHLIDVSYAENLMWNLEDKEKNIAWPYVAKEVRELYEQMWGIPKVWS